MRRSTSVFVLALVSILGPVLLGVSPSAHASKPAVGADMSVSVGSTTGYPDQTATFAVGVENRGPMRATSVELTIQLPAGVRFESTLPDAGCAETAGVVTCPLQSWEVNAAGVFLIAVTPATTGSFPITFTVTAAKPDPDLSNNSRTAVLEVVEPVEADVSIHLSDTQLFAGQPVFYSFDIGNAGPATATDVTATLDFPSGLVPADTARCAATAAGLTCSYFLGEVPPQGGLGVPILLSPAPAGSYTVSGRVSAAQPDPFTSNNSDTAAVEVRAVADVSVQIAESADPATPGQPLTYAVTVSNAGPSPASTVTLVDGWASTMRRLELLSVTTPQGQCSLTAARTIECQLGMLASGASVAVAVTVRPRGSGTVSDEARVSAAEEDPDTADNVDNETTVVGPG